MTPGDRLIAAAKNGREKVMMAYDAPHEIMKVAQKIVDACPSRMDDIDRAALAMDIERALMAESERCAKVAEGIGRIFSDTHSGHACDCAARAIRRTPPEPRP